MPLQHIFFCKKAWALLQLFFIGYILSALLRRYSGNELKLGGALFFGKTTAAFS